MLIRSHYIPAPLTPPQLFGLVTRAPPCRPPMPNKKCQLSTTDHAALALKGPGLGAVVPGAQTYHEIAVLFMVTSLGVWLSDQVMLPSDGRYLVLPSNSTSLLSGLNAHDLANWFWLRPTTTNPGVEVASCDGFVVIGPAAPEKITPGAYTIPTCP